MTETFQKIWNNYKRGFGSVDQGNYWLGLEKMYEMTKSGDYGLEVMLAKDELDEWEENSDIRKLTNIILMGMGEPLYNYEEVSKAIKIII